MEEQAILKNIQIAVQAALNGGEEILRIYAKDDLGVEFKEDESPLTLADIAANDAIVALLEKTGIPILSEEGKALSYDERKDWNHLWIVDPLDGTKEFVKRNGEFTVNIALVENGDIIGGVVFGPVTKELYVACEALGSIKIDTNKSFSIDNLVSFGEQLPVENQLEKFTVVASRSHLTQETSDFIERCKADHGDVEIISRGSSLKLCMVAEGSADCYPRYAPTMEWDTAAGHAICKFAGIQVTDIKTREEMVYNRKELLNNWFLVGNHSLYL